MAVTENRGRHEWYRQGASQVGSVSVSTRRLLTCGLGDAQQPLPPSPNGPDIPSSEFGQDNSGRRGVVREWASRAYTLLGVCSHIYPVDPCLTQREGGAESGNTVFPLRHYLVNITSLHSSIHALLRHTDSPSFQDHFINKTLRVVRVPALSYDNSVPRNRDDWKAAVNHALAKIKVAVPERIVLDAFDEYTKRPPTGNPYVHCEVALIAYFPETRPQPPPLDYIGMSKLCCRACFFVIAAANKTTDLQFRTRGCDGSGARRGFFPRPFRQPSLALYRKARLPSFTKDTRAGHRKMKSRENETTRTL
jgi:hypothetical protein